MNDTTLIASYLDWQLFERTPATDGGRDRYFDLLAPQGARRYQLVLDTTARRLRRDRDAKSIERRQPQIYVWLVCELAELIPDRAHGDNTEESRP